jgi:hypothetical protein
MSPAARSSVAARATAPPAAAASAQPSGSAQHLQQQGGGALPVQLLLPGYHLLSINTTSDKNTAVSLLDCLALYAFIVARHMQGTSYQMVAAAVMKQCFV